MFATQGHALQHVSAPEGTITVQAHFPKLRGMSKVTRFSSFLFGKQNHILECAILMGTRIALKRSTKRLIDLVNLPKLLIIVAMFYVHT